MAEFRYECDYLPEGALYDTSFLEEADDEFFETEYSPDTEDWEEDVDEVDLNY